MNKIYKVVWNKARNCYVVGSEFISSHSAGKTSTIGSKSLKTLLAVFAVCGVMGTAWAADEPSGNLTEFHHYVAFSTSAAVDGETNKDSYGDYLILIDSADQSKKYKYYKKTCTDSNGTTKEYWVRDGYVLTLTKGEYHPLNNVDKDMKADVVWTGKIHPNGTEINDERPTDVLEFGNSMVYQHETTTNAGESLNTIQAGTYVGVANDGGTAVNQKWDYIIYDPSRDDDVTYTNGWVNLQNNNGPKDFVTKGDKLQWDETTQQYKYTNKNGQTTAVDISNLYVIDGKVGIFTTGNGEVYTGSVYGKNNEILMTTKDKNGKYYSYWAAKVTDPSATMASYRVDEYNRNIGALVSNDQVLYHNDIQTVSMEKDKDNNTATINLLRNLNQKPVDGDITITRKGGTNGNDIQVSISNKTFQLDENGNIQKDTAGNPAYNTVEQTFNTGSVVKANDKTNDADSDGGTLEKISINGTKYTISNSSANDWTPMVNGTEVNPTKQGAETKKHVTFVGSNNIDVTAGTGDQAGTITIDGSKLADKNLSNITNNGKTKITDIAKNAVKVSAGNKGITVSQLNKDDDSYDYQVSVNANENQGVQVTNDGVGVKLGNGLSFVKDGDKKGSIQVDTNNVNLSYKAESDKSSKSVSLATGLTFNPGSSGNVTIDTNDKADGIITIDAKNNYVISGKYDKDNQNLILNRNGNLSNVSIDLSDLTNEIKDTALDAGKGIEITTDENNQKKKINVKLKNGENNLDVTDNGLSLKNTLTGIDSISHGGTKISLDTNGVKIIGGLDVDSELITNVKAGVALTDAVNVGQLNQKIADSGWHLSVGDETDKFTAIKPNSNVTFKTDNGVTISKEPTQDEAGNVTGAKVTVGLGDTINVGKITIGKQTSGGDNVEDGKYYITGLDNKEWDEKNYVSGRAATEDQLKEVQDTITQNINTGIGSKQFGLADDKGTTVTKNLDDTVQVKGANGITSTVKDGALEIGLGNGITVGKDGKDGAAGSIGLVGPAGKDGKDGKDGLTTTTIKTEYGPAGVDGKDGITRIIYETKDGDTTIKHEVATLDDGLKFKGDINEQHFTTFTQPL